ncbi:MAG: alpha/beta hydrolase, partial [Polyangiaceae bacterium]
EDDTAIVRHAIAASTGPLIVAGHSYGGFVMSEATAGASNVRALVFVAAFALDEGESIGAVTAAYPTTPAVANITVDDQGNASIEASAFVSYFAPDIPSSQAQVLAAVQHPIAVSVLSTAAGTPGWKTIPSYYQISLDDQAIDPDLQSMFAERMGAETIRLRSSHVSMLSQPAAIAELIERAAVAQGKR